MDTDFAVVPDWFPWENAGASIAVADVDADGRPDVVLLMVDAPRGATPPTTASAGARRRRRAHRRLDRLESRPRLVLLRERGCRCRGRRRQRQRPARPGRVHGRRPGRTERRVTTGSAGTLDTDGRGDRRVDGRGHPSRTGSAGRTPARTSRSRTSTATAGSTSSCSWSTPRRARTPATTAAARSDADGVVTNWRPWQAVPDWPFWENQGAGVAVADLDGDGHARAAWCSPSTTRSGRTAAYYSVGWRLDGAGGRPTGGDPGRADPGLGVLGEPGRCGLASSPLGAAGMPHLVVVRGRRPARAERRLVPRSLDAMTDLEMAPQMGVWRLLEDDSRCSPCTPRCCTPAT